MIIHFCDSSSVSSRFSGYSCLLCVLTVLVLLFPDPSHAGGVLYLFPPAVEGESVAIARATVQHSRTLLTVSQTTLDYSTEQTFVNDNDFPLEGVFFVPLEPDSGLLSVALSVNGTSHPFTLLSAEEFFVLLEELSIAMKDPCLLSLAGKGALIVRPVHIGARRQKSFQVHLERGHALDTDHQEFVVPVDGERYSLGPVAGFEINVRLKLDRPVRTIFSPTHHVSVYRETERRCVVSVRSQDKKVAEDFRLVSIFSGADLDLRVFTHRQPNQKGSFMAFVIPPVQDPVTTQPYKDVVLVLDRSGSIDRSDLELEERAAIAGLQRLHSQDRFNIVTVSTWPKSFRMHLVPATEQNIGEAIRFVSSLPHGGGTDLYNGIFTALDYLSSRKRPSFVILMSDGRSTVGTTNPETLVEQLRRGNKIGARIFSLALGDRADTAVLDNIAAAARGSCFPLTTKRDLDSLTNDVFAVISQPQVSDVSLDFQDLAPEDVVPDSVGDVTGQEGAMVLGRYATQNNSSYRVRLRGKIKGRLKTVNKTFDFPLVDRSRSYISDIWAMRKMARLMEKQRFKGVEPETSEQIANLAKEYGFRTLPATSPAASSWGPLFWQFKTSVVPSDVASDRFRRINDKLFRLDERAWLDTAYRTSMTTSVVPFMGREYFDLLRRQPNLGAYFALGPDVVVVRDGEAVRVQSEGP